MAPPLIDVAAMPPLLGELASRVCIDHIDSCDSTNSELINLVAQGKAVHGKLIVTSKQRAGRGRRGRRWLSAPGQCLCFSLLWRFDRLAACAGLSLAVGLAVAEALRQAPFDYPLQLKWPNDLLLPLTEHPQAYGKCGGILIELTVDKTSPHLPTGAAPHAKAYWAVIGIGINLAAPPDLDDAISALPAVGLNHYHPPQSVEQLLAALLRQMLPILDQLKTHGFAALARRWQDLHAYDGKTLDLVDGTTATLSGRCVGVGDDGHLQLLDQAGHLHEVQAGDLSLRPQLG